MRSALAVPLFLKTKSTLNLLQQTDLVVAAVDPGGQPVHDAVELVARRGVGRVAQVRYDLGVSREPLPRVLGTDPGDKGVQPFRHLTAVLQESHDAI